MNDTARSPIRMLDPTKNHSYIPKVFRKLEIPDEKKPTYSLRPLTKQDRAEIDDQVLVGTGIGQRKKEEFKTGTVTLLTLKKGLRGWKNHILTDPGTNEQKDIPFEPDRIDEMINLIPNDIADEMARYIRNQSEVEPGE